MREHYNGWLLILVAVAVVFSVVLASAMLELEWPPMYSIVAALAVMATVGVMVLTYLVVRSRRKDDQP